jgi:glycogen debranching enzyme
VDDVIKVKDRYYILAPSTRADERTRVLKHGDMFGVFDAFGDIRPYGLGEQGIYYEGTRFLSRLELHLGSVRPLLLSSVVKQDNELLAVDLTNPDIQLAGEAFVPRGVLHIFRSRFLWEGACFERLRIWNYALDPVDVALDLDFDADYADIFEVRGIARPRSGERLPEEVGERTIVLGYLGLDGVVRQTRIEAFPAPSNASATTMRFDTELQPHTSATFSVTIRCEAGKARRECVAYDRAYAASTGQVIDAREGVCAVDSSNEQFNDWLNRSIADMRMMLTETPHGVYPYAGVPWFNTAFGRDGIITALEMLWAEPGIARGVLSYLAATQATSVVPEQDAEPGKILHETRKGEMAALGEVPFGRYYGSVDATPLFVMLAGAYYRRTGDRAFVETIWPNLARAIEWMDTFGDADGDGFLEYARRSPKGLAHQGWKDSQDAVFHADGRLAEAPIALCEVQAYAYGARLAGAALAALLGHHDRARDLTRGAEALGARFEDAFWCEDLSTYALALDGEKRPCRVRTSNAGHCLFTGIARPNHAARVAATLLSDDAFSGWGIRTLAASEVRYNPMSYHNGSVWPHDNAIIAAGFSRYGLKPMLVKPLTGLFDATLFVDLHRLPELFCGFHRRSGEGPTLYPVACSPQAWSVGTVFLLIEACLGLDVDAGRRRVTFSRPMLPEFLQRVRIRRLFVGDATLDVVVKRYASDVSVNVLRREGDVEVVVIK